MVSFHPFRGLFIMRVTCDCPACQASDSKAYQTFTAATTEECLALAKASQKWGVQIAGLDAETGSVLSSSARFLPVHFPPEKQSVPV